MVRTSGVETKAFGIAEHVIAKFFVDAFLVDAHWVETMLVVKDLEYLDAALIESRQRCAHAVLVLGEICAGETSFFSLLDCKLVQCVTLLTSGSDEMQ